MWPFGGDKHELIDSGYLKKNGINEDYRDAFNMKNRKLKEEIKRNEKVKKQSEDKIANLEADIRTQIMKTKELQANIDILSKAAKDDDVGSALEIEKLDSELNQIGTQLEFFIEDQDEAKVMLNTCEQTINLLQMILRGVYTSPKQLTDGGVELEGGNIENLKDKRDNYRERALALAKERKEFERKMSEGEE